MLEYGAEDAVLVERLNSAFVASGLYYMTERSLESKGQIFLYNFSQPQGQYKAIPLKLEGDFDENYKSVEPISTVDLYTVPDNVHVDETGALWIGAHPIVSELIAHSASPDNLQISAPSQKWTITEPYMNDGSELVASSVAVPYYGQLLIGSIYRTILHCDIAHSSVL
uniref:Arylesterase n=1 Tax=Parascaris equorum TaxID=6256 RepID=A0A914RXP7_PAREQ